MQLCRASELDREVPCRSSLLRRCPEWSHKIHLGGGREIYNSVSHCEAILYFEVNWKCYLGTPSQMSTKVCINKQAINY